MSHYRVFYSNRVAEQTVHIGNLNSESNTFVSKYQNCTKPKWYLLASTESVSLLFYNDVYLVISAGVWDLIQAWCETWCKHLQFLFVIFHAIRLTPAIQLLSRLLNRASTFHKKIPSFACVETSLRFLIVSSGSFSTAEHFASSYTWDALCLNL